MVLRIAGPVLLMQVMVLAEARTIPGYEGEMKKVVERAMQQYRGAKTYRDDLSVKVDAEVESLQPVRLPEEPLHASLAWAGPNRIALDTSVYAVYCDGEHLWEHLKETEHYTVSAAPERVDLSRLQLASFPVYEQIRHPIAAILGAADASPDDLFGRLSSFDGVRAEVRGNRPGQRLSGTITVEIMPGHSAEVSFTAWVADASGLIEEIRYDHARHVQMLMSLSGTGMTIKKYVRELRLEDVAINEPKIAERSFAFEPRPFDEKVARLRLLQPAEWQAKLLGRPAPEFAAKDMDGRLLILSDLKGRVVLLDFWASFCGPCIVAMPTLQRLADKYTDKPVSVIGINGDPPAQVDRVRSILDAQKIKYRQIVDTKSEVFAAYRVQPIPCLFLIGKKGHVQAIHTGFGFGEEQKLAREIDKLLAGEDLVPLREPAATRPGG